MSIKFSIGEIERVFGWAVGLPRVNPKTTAEVTVKAKLQFVASESP